jgi:hypothetical protein
LDEYVRLVNKNTEFFTTEAPEDVWAELLGYFEEKGFTFTPAADKYKIKVQQPLSEDQEIEYSVRLLKAAHDKTCVEFNRNGGDQLEFFNHFAAMKEELDLEDTVY